MFSSGGAGRALGLCSRGGRLQEGSYVAFTSQIFWECMCVLGEGSGRGKRRNDELVGPCSGLLRNAKEAGLWLSYA